MTSPKRKRTDSGNNKDNKTELYDVVIVGGGLSGLTVAHYLNRSNINYSSGSRRRKLKWKLLEASSRIGGRLMNDDDGMKIDLGGAWIWRRNQPKIMRTLVRSPELKIRTFHQPGDKYSSSDTTRIVGGAFEIAKQLYDGLVQGSNEDDDPSNNNNNNEKQVVETECPVTSLRRNSDGTISVASETGRAFRARYVVLAAPPRILSERVSFHPELPHRKRSAMAASETWMAGVTKVALVYKGERPSYWSFIVGEGSRLSYAYEPNEPRRPAFQVYDGSPWDETIVVLTFFTLPSRSNRDSNDDDRMLAEDCAEQFCACLPGAALREFVRSYDAIQVQRWPLEPYVSHDPSPTDLTPHPAPIPELAKQEWDGCLIFAGTETDQRSPGVMEGAVGAATRAVGELAKELNMELLE